MIEILTTSLFVFSSIYGAPVADAGTISSSTVPEAAAKIEEVTVKNRFLSKKQLELEEVAKEYFQDYPILVKIAECESQFRQFDSKGNVLLGRVNKSDRGFMQINKYYHGVKSDELGFDIDTLEGNMAYAKYLYEKEGTKPWNSSSKCWKESIQPAPSNLVAINKN